MEVDEIYNRMLTAYEREAGFTPDAASDVAIKLRTVAAEIYSARLMVDELADAAFPQTALGEALDMHAGERGLYRKPAVCASGELTFSRDTALSYDVGIPAGTVCAASVAAVEYETTEDAVLRAGELRVTVGARAALGGSGGNAAKGRVDTIVTIPAGIESVTNERAFEGGTEAESDDVLRRRLLECYCILPNGSNRETYRRTALETPGVAHANVVPRADGIGTVTVYVYGESSPVADEVLSAVRKRLEALREVNVDITVRNAEPITRRVSAYISVKPGCTFAEAQRECTAAINACFERFSIGESFAVAAFTAAVMGTGTVQNCTWTAGTTDHTASAGEIIVPGEITLLEMS